MIDTSLSAICSALNQHFRNRFGFTKDKVKLSNVIRSDDSNALGSTDKIAVTLVNLQHETNVRYKSPNLSDSPIHFTMFVLFSVYFGEESSYDQALKELSALLSFFQANHIFTSQNAPELPAEIERLTFKYENQAINEQQNMWSMLGGKHVPCAMYRVNIVPLHEGAGAAGIVGRVGVGF